MQTQRENPIPKFIQYVLHLLKASLSHQQKFRFIYPHKKNENAFFVLQITIKCITQLQRRDDDPSNKNQLQDIHSTKPQWEQYIVSVKVLVVQLPQFLHEPQKAKDKNSFFLHNNRVSISIYETKSKMSGVFFLKL